MSYLRKDLIAWFERNRIDAEILEMHGRIEVRVRKKHLELVHEVLEQRIAFGIFCRVSRLGFFELRSWKFWRRGPNINVISTLSLVRDAEPA